jgi:hypothetical protein
MQHQDFTRTFTVDPIADAVFAAVVDVPAWWTGTIEGETRRVGAEFTYRYGDVHYSKQKVTELVPGRKVVWRVVDSHLDGPGDPDEWTGTEIVFDITPQGDRTEVRFVHRGLVPELDCFESCSNGWSFYIDGSLRRLLTTGEGPTRPPWA